MSQDKAIKSDKEKRVQYRNCFALPTIDESDDDELPDRRVSRLIDRPTISRCRSPATWTTSAVPSGSGFSLQTS